MRCISNTKSVIIWSDAVRGYLDYNYVLYLLAVIIFLMMVDTSWIDEVKSTAVDYHSLNVMYSFLFQVPANSISISGPSEIYEVPVIKKMKTIREIARKKSKIQIYSFHLLT